MSRGSLNARDDAYCVHKEKVLFILSSWDVFSPPFFLRRTAVDSAAVEMFHGLNIVCPSQETEQIRSS